ncbi:MAG: TolB family protein, partial [Thermoanaerobaculia bacterium]
MAQEPPQPQPQPEPPAPHGSGGPEPPDPEAQEKEDAWKVSDPPGPSYLATLDVDEGTWMSVDVSPDGRQIVFDLLGDLYLLPIEGGDAKALTTGVEWDMQARFSPDGKWIAFTSDRSGGDNIW